jgi:hypothetical protein
MLLTDGRSSSASDTLNVQYHDTAVGTALEEWLTEPVVFRGFSQALQAYARVVVPLIKLWLFLSTSSQILLSLFFLLFDAVKQTKNIYLLRQVGETHGSLVLGSVEIIPQQMGIGSAPLFTQCPCDNYHFLIVLAALVCTCVCGSCDTVSEELGGVCVHCIAMGHEWQGQKSV